VNNLFKTIKRPPGKAVEKRKQLLPYRLEEKGVTNEAGPGFY